MKEENEVLIEKYTIVWFLLKVSGLSHDKKKQQSPNCDQCIFLIFFPTNSLYNQFTTLNL